MNSSQSHLASAMLTRNGRPWFSVHDLAQRTGRAPRPIRNALRPMQDSGYVEKGQEGYTGPTYRLTSAGAAALAARRGTPSERLAAREARALAALKESVRTGTPPPPPPGRRHRVMRSGA